LRVGNLEVAELYLNLGCDAQGLKEGERVTVNGVLTERKLVTRSGKIRRGGIYQITVQEVLR
jgi:hypothetical protein